MTMRPSVPSVHPPLDLEDLDGKLAFDIDVVDKKIARESLLDRLRARDAYCSARSDHARSGNHE